MKVIEYTPKITRRQILVSIMAGGGLGLLLQGVVWFFGNLRYIPLMVFSLGAFFFLTFIYLRKN